MFALSHVFKIKRQRKRVVILLIRDDLIVVVVYDTMAKFDWFLPKKKAMEKAIEFFLLFFFIAFRFEIKSKNDAK